MTGENVHIYQLEKHLTGGIFLTRYVCIRLNEQQELQFVVGEFVFRKAGHTQLVPKSGRTAAFTGDQFMLLCGLVYCGMTDPDMVAAVHSGNISHMIPLGVRETGTDAQVYFAWNSFEGVPYLHVRRHLVQNDNSLVATADGVSFNLKNFEAFKALLMEDDFLTKVNEVLRNRAAHSHAIPPTVNEVSLVKSISFELARMYQRRLQFGCLRCRELNMQFLYPIRQSPQHTCMWVDGTMLVLRPGMKNELMKELMASKKLKGMFMMLLPFGSATNFDNVTSFIEEKLSGLLRDHEIEIWSTVREIMCTTRHAVSDDKLGDVDVRLDNGKSHPSNTDEAKE